MKKYISASSGVVVSDVNQYKQYLESLDDNAYHFYYELEMPTGDVLTSKLIFKPVGDKAKFLPVIEVKVENSSENPENVWFTPSMIMPERIDGSDMDYSDSFEYYMDGYLSAGKFCTMLFRSEYIPWEDDED